VSKTEQRILAPYGLDAEEGSALWYLGTLLKVKATGRETNGKYSLVEELCPRDFGTPWHVHRREDESFLIIDGEATFFVGDGVIEARAGSFVFLPQGIPHAFRIESDSAHLFNLITPAGFEDFYLDLSEPARELVMPPPLEDPPDFQAIAPAAAKYDCEILGPPPS
jgi:quercetin dioxygenase-like cupin family protein